MVFSFHVDKYTIVPWIRHVIYKVSAFQLQHGMHHLLLRLRHHLGKWITCGPQSCGSCNEGFLLKIYYLVIQVVTFLGWLSDPFKGFGGDLQPGDEKVTA